MAKRFFFLVLASVAFAFTAHAATWSLSTRVMTSGGSLQVRSEPPRTSANGTVMKTYTTSSIVPVSLLANTGYAISAVTVNGASQPLPVPNPVSMGLPAFNPIKTSQSLTVSFARQMVSVSASVTPGGTVSPSTASLLQLGSTATYTFTPANGGRVYKISGLPVGATLTNSSGVAVTLPYQGQVRATFTVPGSAVTLFGAFLPLTVSVGPPQTVIVGETARLSATSVVHDGASSVSYAWTQTRGAPVTLYGANSANPYFIPTAAELYHFTVLATDSLGGTGSATAQVTATASTLGTARTQCQNCHDQAGIAPAANVFGKWSSSGHKPAAVMCAACHIGADTGGHPGLELNSPTLLNACSNCHSADANFTASHPFPAGGNICVTCHNAHSLYAVTPDTPPTHFNNITSAGYPASFVTSNTNCIDCHNNDAGNLALRNQWKTTGHGATGSSAWMSRDFKTLSGCVQCHSTTGFIAYSTGRVTAAWGKASDKTKEVLNCSGCHSDILAGVVRVVAPISPFADDSYQNRDMQKSNICAGCHSGINSGNSIAMKVESADFGNLPFIQPHSLTATSNMQGKGGYHFPGRSYSNFSSNFHRVIGLNNRSGTGYSGPCINCHMAGAERHLYKSVTNDENGVITAISPLCANCHGGTLDAAVLNNNRTLYKNALEVLKAALSQKGIVYSEAERTFLNTEWGEGQAGADTMGAAYNYALLLSEPGAYTHNWRYSRQLIADSIDYLQNGAVTGSVDSALANLVTTGAITQKAADDLVSYEGTQSCLTCHNNSYTGSHQRHEEDLISCGQCHYTTSVSGSILVSGTETHINGGLDVVVSPINNKSGGTNFSVAGSSCSGVTCHGNGAVTVTWGGSASSCEGCHLGNLSVIDGVTAPDMALDSSRGHGKPGLGYQCLDCHDRTKRHRGGLGRLNEILTGSLNTECNYCHNDPGLIQNEAMINLGTHITKTGGYMACSDCHDPHGSTNLSMIKSSILGQPISYSGENDLIDNTTYLGLCQVCHTETKYYRAGVRETVHESGGCLGCHQHKSVAGGFMINPRKYCDSCHGYPPAPKRTLQAMGFQTMNNWSSATFEDYSGGGGAHLVQAHVPREASRLDGWINCVKCHDSRNHPADMSLENEPVLTSRIQVNVDSRYRFSNSFTVYTGAKLVDPPQRNQTGSCFNISCHMAPSPRWSIER